MKTTLTSENYNEILQGELPVVIDFSATWCGPCQKISPMIDELAEEFKGRVAICGCDVDDNNELAVKYNVRNIPTIVFIKNGEVVDKMVGAAPKNAFQEKINSLL